MGSNLKGKKIFSIEQHKKVLSEAGQVFHCTGFCARTSWCPQARILSCCLLSYRQGRVQDDQNLVEEHPGVLKPGYCPVVFSRTAKVACKMTKILWKMGKKTGGAKVENPPELSQFESAEIEFEPTAPLFVEPFAQCAALGRFAVMDSNRLKMLGKVSSVVHGES